MKASKKMQATIERMEKKYGQLNKDFFVEVHECNRVGNGFFDGCRLTSPMQDFQSINITVAHDGTYYIN